MKSIQLLTCITILALSSCDKFLDGTSAPINTIPAENLFENDAMVSSVVSGILTNNNTNNFSATLGRNIEHVLSMYCDETKSVSPANVIVETFHKNRIQSTNSPFWNNIYQQIYMINTAISGITQSKSKLIHKDQWLGECYFLRAFNYFHLVNLYGAIPLALTDDFRKNSTLYRSSEEEVYQQIIQDLQLAKSLLSDTYRDGLGQETTKRLRPNKSTASALLARIYLYTEDWENAEKEASLVLNDTRFALTTLDQTFLGTSKESIWSLAASTANTAAPYRLYNKGMPAILSGTQTPTSPFAVHTALNEKLYDTFDIQDARKISWIRTSVSPATATRPEIIYRFPNKYKSAANNAEYYILFRLAEQYLIRAEARAKQGLINAIDDLNVVRRRAGLENIQPIDILAAIANERRFELFTEGPHRFYDLKRTGKIDEVMTIASISKPSIWESYMSLWPIPNNDLIQNPNITPNPGYNY